MNYLFNLINEKDKCLKCGRSCHWKLPNGSIERCKYLTKDNLCSVYETRIGRVLNEEFNVRCHFRRQQRTDRKDCPYNSGKPIMDVGY
jgi:hypothetical protein